jgi:hypothetical protein
MRYRSVNDGIHRNTAAENDIDDAHPSVTRLFTEVTGMILIIYVFDKHKYPGSHESTSIFRKPEAVEKDSFTSRNVSVDDQRISHDFPQIFDRDMIHFVFVQQGLDLAVAGVTG